MDCTNKTDCKDKKSLHYFMCHMTQKEFEKKFIECMKKEQENYQFNKINYDNGTTSPTL